MVVASVVVALLGVETTMVPLVAPMVAPVASVALVHHGGTMVAPWCTMITLVAAPEFLSNGYNA